MAGLWVCPQCDAVHNAQKIDGDYVKRGDCPSCRIEKGED